MRNMWHNGSPTDSLDKPFGKTGEETGESGGERRPCGGVPSHRVPRRP